LPCCRSHNPPCCNPSRLHKPLLREPLHTRWERTFATLKTRSKTICAKNHSKLDCLNCGAKSYTSRTVCYAVYASGNVNVPFCLSKKDLVNVSGTVCFGCFVVF
jgi:hypothetical protein